jgi:pimeloyl-ACP methyl ester carboxylesterase
MHQHAEDLDRLCRELNIAKAAFAGVSLGGYVLQEFIKSFPQRASALILSDTRANADSPDAKASRFKAIQDVKERGPEAYIRKQSESVLGETTRRNRPDIAEAAIETMRRSTVEGVTALQQGMAERPDYIDSLRAIKVPTLLIFGEEDTATPPDIGHAMQQKISGSVMRVVPRAGHYAAFEQSDEVAGLLREFLASAR